MADNAIFKAKRKRTTFEEKDKEMLCLILKQTDGVDCGRLLKRELGPLMRSLLLGRKLLSCSTRQPTIIVIENK